MADHRQHMAVVVVGGAVRVGEEILRVEDVETLVLHRAHREIVGGDDVEDVEVVAAAEALLVPAHRLPQAPHGPTAAADRVGFGVDHQTHAAAFGGDEAVLDRFEPAGDQREQIARLRMRVDKARPVAPIRQFAGAVGIAVREQQRKACRICAQRDRVAREHVGAIGKRGDAAKTLRFALGQQEAAVQRAAQVQALQRGIALRRDAHARLDDRACVQARDRQALRGARVLGRAEHAIVDAHVEQLQSFGVELERRVGLRGVLRRDQARRHLGRGRIEIEREIDVADAPGRRAVVVQESARLGAAGVVHRGPPPQQNRTGQASTPLAPACMVPPPCHAAPERPHVRARTSRFRRDRNRCRAHRAARAAHAGAALALARRARRRASCTSSARTCSASARSSSAAPATRCGRWPTPRPRAAWSRIPPATTAPRSRWRRARAASRRTWSCREGAVPAKLAAIAAYGATLHRCAPTHGRARGDGRAGAGRRPARRLVHPYTDPRVIAGQGTAALELLGDSRSARCAGRADRRRRPDRRQRDRRARAAAGDARVYRGRTGRRRRRARLARARRARHRPRAGHDLRRPARHHRARSTSSCCARTRSRC